MARTAIILWLSGILITNVFAEATPEWSKPSAIPTESDAFQNRLEQPQNHFLLDGIQGFVSGREFYQSAAEVSPFLWTSSPYLHFGPDRSWQNDSTPLIFHGSAGMESEYPALSGEIGYQVFEELRFHGGFDQIDAFSSRSYPSRLGLIGTRKPGDLAWMGENLPLRSQANLGGTFSHRGAILAVQANQGWWWTASPVSGRVYPWEGYNAELTYGVGEDFQLSLVGQEWDSPIRDNFYHAHYGRSELNMSFLNSSPGGWIWRFDIGFQRREMISDSIFIPFEQKSYPTRFRYRQNWQAPDSIPLLMISQGILSFRDRMISLQHSSDFHEKWGPDQVHQVRQTVKGYYRRPVKGYKVPTETFLEDTSWLAEARPGQQARGLSSELEYREKRKSFEVGLSVNHVMEWEAPLFQIQNLDTIDGHLIRSGSYQGSHYLLQNASVRFFAGGGLGFRSKSGLSGSDPAASSTSKNLDDDEASEENNNEGQNQKGQESGGFWRLEAGYRDFWGKDAESMEFLPSHEWVGAGGGWSFPFKLRADMMVNYMGEKEVRGWGKDFKVPAHLENNLSLEQSVLGDRLKVTVALLHAFGEKVLEQPNGNPMRMRVLGAVSGKF